MGRTFGFALFQVVYLDLHCMLGFSLDLEHGGGVTGVLNPNNQYNIY